MLWAGCLCPGERGELGRASQGPSTSPLPGAEWARQWAREGAVPLAVGLAAPHYGSVPRTPQVAPPSPTLASLGTFCLEFAPRRVLKWVLRTC